VEATALEVDALAYDRMMKQWQWQSTASPDPDVRLIRNIWPRKGVLERVRGVKFMWGLFACNELLHRRFGSLDSSSCSCCTGTAETPWHVIGECNDADAVMLPVLAHAGPIGCGMQKGKTALHVDVANSVRRLWKVDDDGRIHAWAPGNDRPSRHLPE
jgi:hypothetical protein